MPDPSLSVGNRTPQEKAPAPSKPAQPTPPVRPTAPRARRRRRHVFLMLSFWFLVVVPVGVAIFYLETRAADQFGSDMAFSVRSEEQSSAIELLGGITEFSGSSSSDSDILYAYLSSQELVSKVNARVDLESIWSRISAKDDPIFAFQPTGLIEDLHDHWNRKVSIIYDSGTRIITARILAFTPRDAQAIAQAMLDESTLMINELSAIAREDAIRYAREDLDAASTRLRTARQALTTFRNRTQIVDPSIDTQNQMGVLVTLQQQLADALIELGLLRDTTNDGDPRITQANRRVDVIQTQIDAERRKLGLGGGAQGGVVFADLVGEYEGLVVDREFAEIAYKNALASYEGALADSRRQSRYLAAHIAPTFAEKAQYPERIKLIALMALFSFLTWSIVCLVYYSLRDRS